MHITTQTKSYAAQDAANELAKAQAAQNFKMTQTAQTAQSNMKNSLATTAASQNAGLVAPMTNPLSGSAAEVFSRAGIISITEPTRATITFEREDTDFKNTLLMYKLDASGNLKETKAIFPNASAVDSGGQMKDGLSFAEVDLEAGDQVAFAVLPNGFANEASRELLARKDGNLAVVNWRGEPANLFNDSPDAMQLVHVDPWGNKRPISGEYGNKLFHSAGNEAQGIRTNFDGKDHADQIVDADRGKLLVGFDDKLGAEGAARNNLMVSMDFGQNNAAALNQNMIDETPKSFREMAGADWSASLEEIMTTARMFDKDNDGRLNEEEWAEFAPLLNLTADDHKHFVGLRGRGDLDSLALMISRGDVNGNGALDEREVLEFGRRLNGNNPNSIQSFREAAGIDWKLDYEEFISTAESHDKNGNGLDQDEWDRFAPILGLTPDDRKLFVNAEGHFDIARFKTVFPLADKNGDGQLDPREVLDLRRLVLENFTPVEDEMTIQPHPYPIEPEHPTHPKPGMGFGTNGS